MISLNELSTLLKQSIKSIQAHLSATSADNLVHILLTNAAQSSLRTATADSASPSAKLPLPQFVLRPALLCTRGLAAF